MLHLLSTNCLPSWGVCFSHFSLPLFHCLTPVSRKALPISQGIVRRPAAYVQAIDVHLVAEIELDNTKPHGQLASLLAGGTPSSKRTGITITHGPLYCPPHAHSRCQSFVRSPLCPRQLSSCTLFSPSPPTF